MGDPIELSTGRRALLDMAIATPWMVRTTKRKVATTRPGPRKRRRASLPAEDHADSRSRIRKQQTLTQIIPSISRPLSFDDGELDEIKIESKIRIKARAQRRKKRDSTLTQMGFIGNRMEMAEDDMRPIAVSAPELTNILQLDGTYNSPRKPRPVKGGSHRKRKRVSLQAEESQEYVPATKLRTGKTEIDNTPDQAQRRRSARHSSRVPSDPIENYAVFQEKLADATPNIKTPALEIKDLPGFDKDTEDVGQPQRGEVRQQSAARPIFEIQDSVESMNEDIEVLAVSPLKTILKTPQKQRHYIPSSQSPDSLPPTTKKKDQNSPNKHDAMPRCKPLAELTTNTPTRRPLLNVEMGLKSVSVSKKKVGTLKLPSKPLHLGERRIEDSQIDVWSVLPTSSSKKGESQKTLRAAIQNEAMTEEAVAEIPSTSQVRPVASLTSSSTQSANGEPQESLPSPDTLFGIKRKGTIYSKEGQSEHAPRFLNVKARDFVEQPQETPRKSTQYVSLLDPQPLASASAVHADDGSGFGSPVANDTQFDAHLRLILTSPLRTSIRDQLRNLNPHDTICISSYSPSEEHAPSSSLRAPKLVDRVEYQNSTTTVPTKYSSSPILPPLPPPSQRPIAPASLPHPSQMSTQEASQQFPQVSSVPQHSPARIHRITIKDSSSMYTPLSQLPEYNEDELQLQRELERSQHAGPDDEDEDDNLDPRSPRKVVRFQEPTQEPEPHGEQHNEQNAVPEPSSPSQHVHFTQNGHVTAARIEDMRKRGLIPPGYQPPAYQVPPARELLPAWMFEDDDDHEL